MQNSQTPEALFSLKFHNLERRIDKIYTWATAAFMTATLMLSLSTFWVVRWVDKAESSIQTAIPQIQTDVALIKKEQEGQREESRRTWTLINKLIKEPKHD